MELITTRCYCKNCNIIFIYKHLSASIRCIYCKYECEKGYKQKEV